MNKAIGLVFALMVLSIASAMATDPTGFVFNKDAVATGDWAWDGDSWNYGNYPTAHFAYTATSPSSTSAIVNNFDDLGIAWKYEQSTHVESNAPVEYSALFDAWTLNDPKTTPATGGYTKYAFSQNTQSVFSGVSASVSGYGAIHFTSFTQTDASSMQDTYGKIN